MKNINHIWSILCKKTIIDQKTNNVSIFEVFEQLTVKMPPLTDGPRKNGEPIVIPQPHEMVSLWSRDDIGGEYVRKTELEITDPVGKKMIQNSFNLRFSPNVRRVRVMTTIEAMPLTTSGIYHYRLYLLPDDIKQNKEMVVDIPLEVNIEFGK